MKIRLLFAFFLLFAFLKMNAQDYIVNSTHDTIFCKITKITPKSLYYMKGSFGKVISMNRVSTYYQEVPFPSDSTLVVQPLADTYFLPDSLQIKHKFGSVYELNGKKILRRKVIKILAEDTATHHELKQYKVFKAASGISLIPMAAIATLGFVALFSWNFDLLPNTDNLPAIIVSW